MSVRTGLDPIDCRSSYKLTFDVEVQRVALAVGHSVGGHAGVETRGGELHALKHQGLVTEDHTFSHILLEPLALKMKSVYYVKVVFLVFG